MSKLLTTILSLSLAGPALGQTPGAQRPLSPLAGPPAERVGPRAPLTLIERDFEGKIKKLDIPPHEAAIRLLDLDEPTRKRVDEAVAARHAILDKLVAENLRQIVELVAARESGNRAEAARLMSELSDASRPLRDLGPTERQIQAVLTAEQVELYVKLRQDYWNAVIEEAQQEARKTGQEFKMREFMREQLQGAVGGEARRAYERVVGQRARDFDDLLKALNLGEEQESRIRRLVTDSFQKTYGEASISERARIIAAIYRELDESQRRLLFERLGVRDVPAPEGMPQRK